MTPYICGSTLPGMAEEKQQQTPPVKKEADRDDDQPVIYPFPSKDVLHEVDPEKLPEDMG